MEPTECAPPQDNVLDLSDMELCPKCKEELLRRFLKMYNEAVIDKPWNQEDLDGYRDGKTPC